MVRKSKVASHVLVYPTRFAALLKIPQHPKGREGKLLLVALRAVCVVCGEYFVCHALNRCQVRLQTVKLCCASDCKPGV